MSAASPASPALKRGQLMALIAAFLGWAFDGFEMGLFPLAGRPAIAEMLAQQNVGGLDQSKWFAVIMAVFLVGAATGGVLFGWLGDKIGRVKAMALSIGTYAIFSGLGAFVNHPWELAVLRFIASLGMGGEWSLGVALVNEIWPGKSRAWVAGLIGAAANFGFLAVGLLSLGISEWMSHLNEWAVARNMSEETVTRWFSGSGWRLLMLSGAVPALLVFLVRMFVPESEKWEKEHASGHTSHWRTSELGGVAAGALAAMGIIYAWSPWGKDHAFNSAVAWLITVAGLVVVFWGYLRPVRGYLSRAIAKNHVSTDEGRVILNRMLLGAGLAGVALLGTWGSIQWAPRWAGELAEASSANVHHAIAYTQIATAAGAILIAFLAPLVGDLLGRRLTYMLCCLCSLAIAVAFFNLNDTVGSRFYIFAFFAGGITASFYGFFPLYFPELFPTSVRATGQGFCFNVGRVLAAIMGLQVPVIMGWFDGDFAKAGTILASIYIVGALIIWLGPETKGKALT